MQSRHIPCSPPKIEGSTERCYLLFFNKIISKGFEQGGRKLQSFRKQMLRGEHLCRRGNERSEAIGTVVPGQNPLLRRQIKALDLIQVLFYFKRYTLWDSNPERVRSVKKTVQ